MIDKTAIVDEGAVIGDGTRVWHFTHIREGAEIGADCNIGQGVYIDNDVTIGNRCKVQNGANLYGPLTIFDEVFVGPGAIFTNDYWPRARYDDFSRQLTVVKKGASIGAGATVLPGIIIGEYAMVGAGAVVTKDVGAKAVVKGVPAK